MTQHKRCHECQTFFRPEAVCFRCAAVDWLLSLSWWERMQLIWFLLHPPAPEKQAEEDVKTAVDQPHHGETPHAISRPRS